MTHETSVIGSTVLEVTSIFCVSLVCEDLDRSFILRFEIAFRKSCSVDLIRDFTVPSGSPILALISEWLSPDTYANLKTSC